VDAEVYGNIVYNNGTHGNQDHGIYVHNMSGTKLVMDNVFFDNKSYGVHVYAQIEDGPQRNVHLVDGQISDFRPYQPRAEGVGAPGTAELMA